MKPEYMTVRISTEMKEDLRKMAESNHRTLAGEMIRLIELGLKVDAETSAILAGKTQIDPSIIQG